MKKIILVLPWPPSVNHYWRKWNNRIVISKEGRTFREDVCDLLHEYRDGPPAFRKRVAMMLDVFPPDRRRRDLDNIQKAVLDALQHANLYRDDNQIDFLLTQRKGQEADGAVIVTISDMPLRYCLACGGAMQLGAN